jgi:hypothetical protein
METYEFKLRMLHDYRDWEDIPPHDRQQMTRKAAQKHAESIASHPSMVEVRYNVAGSPQGHYVRGHDDTRQLHQLACEEGV